MQEFFPKGRHPKATCKKTEIVHIIQQLEGATLAAGVSACFHTAATELPEKGLIESFATEQRAADMSIKLTSGTLDIEGSPVRRVSWTLREQKAFVTLNAERKDVVDSDYLVRCMEWIRGQFELFILGRAPDAPC